MDKVSFTVDMKKLVNVACNDPSVRADIEQGIKDFDAGVRIKLTDQLGAANLNAGEGNAPHWMSLFIASNQAVQSGQAGLIYRNDRQEGKGERIQMRLKKQPPKTHAAVTPGQAIAAVVTPTSIDFNNPNVQSMLALLAQAQALPVVQETVTVADVDAELAAALQTI